MLRPEQQQPEPTRSDHVLPTPATSTTDLDLLSQATAAFGEWVAALSGGDTDRAWELMASSSRLALGSKERFEEMGTGLAEGWGSWVAVEDPLVLPR